MDKFTQHYLIAALWSSTDDEGEPLDRDHDITDLPAETVARAEADCAAFQTINAELLSAAYEMYAPHVDAPTPECSAGHDFWLTRCGHGAGFWDRGFGEIGDKLTQACKAFGEIDLYAGDNGKLYFA